MSAPHGRIVFSLDQQESPKSALDEERDKHKTRAERFGTDYKDPAELPKFSQQARLQRLRREGFATGIDLFSEEEQAKRAARAKKFGLPEDRQAPLQYAPDPEDAKRAARAKKFGAAYQPPTADTLLQKADLFEPRKDAPEDLPRREEAVYLYGVDVMSTKDCLQYFDDYGPTLVEWINDSSCCVVFADAATTRRAIAGSGHPLTPEELNSAPDDMDQVMTDANLDPAAHIPYLWHKGRDFIQTDFKGNETKVPLLYRMATVLDEKNPHADKRSRYLWKTQGKRQYHEYSQGRQQQQQQGEADGDAAMKRQRGPRGGRRHRRQQQNGQGEYQDGDEDMHDVEYVDAAAAEEQQALPEDPQERRRHLKMADAARRQAEEELQYEEVPQPDEDADGI